MMAEDAEMAEADVGAKGLEGRKTEDDFGEQIVAKGEREMNGLTGSLVDEPGVVGDDIVENSHGGTIIGGGFGDGAMELNGGERVGSIVEAFKTDNACGVGQHEPLMEGKPTAGERRAAVGEGEGE
jgi:hypothetical protein